MTTARKVTKNGKGKRKAPPVTGGEGAGEQIEDETKPDTALDLFPPDAVTATTLEDDGTASLADRLRAAGEGKALWAATSDIDADFDNWPHQLADEKTHNHIRDRSERLREAGTYDLDPVRVRTDGSKVYALDRVSLIAAQRAVLDKVLVVLDPAKPEDAIIRYLRLNGGLALGNKEKDRAISKILTTQPGWLGRAPGWLAFETGIRQETIVACAKRHKLEFRDRLLTRDGRTLNRAEALDHLRPSATTGSAATQDGAEADGEPITYWAAVRWPVLPEKDFVRVTVQRLIDRATGIVSATVSYELTVGNPVGVVIEAKEGRWRMTGAGAKAKFDSDTGLVRVEAEVEILATKPEETQFAASTGPTQGVDAQPKAEPTPNDSILDADDAEGE